MNRWMSIDRAGHGPLGGKAELAEMRGYLALLKAKPPSVRREDDRRAAAADISLGKYDNWIGPERIIMDTQRFYLEFAGKLTPGVDTDGIRQATEDYTAARRGR